MFNKHNTAYVPFLANYWPQQAFNARVNALEQQTQWRQKELPNTLIIVDEHIRVMVLSEADRTQTIWRPQEKRWSIYSSCHIEEYPAETYAILPSLESQIVNAVSNMNVLTREIEEIQVQFTNVPKWLMPSDMLRCLREVQTEREAIAIVRHAGYEFTANRLVELKMDEEDLDPDEQPLNFASMKQFIGFMLTHGNLKEPGITVTNEGNVKATWQQSDSQIFWIEFAPNDDVRYLAFVPNEERSDHVERTAGWSTISVIYERAMELRAMDWMIV